MTNSISLSLFELLEDFLNELIKRTKKLIYEYFLLFFKSFIN